MVDESLKVRFSQKWLLNKENGCWEWSGSRFPSGYGQIKLTKQRKQEYAHRVSYEIHKGVIPKGMNVLHRCDNPCCVNPDHLWIGTDKENQQDMKAKGRSLQGERNSMSVLTVKDVLAIKELLARSIYPQWKIGELFGVGQMEVSRIKRGLRWAHVK